MKFIPTSVHGILDYMTALLLVFAPWLLGFSDHHAATLSMVGIGSLFACSSLFTDYETGLVRLLPMKLHLAIDAVGGGFLATSPWLFRFASDWAAPHLIAGLFAVVVSLVTTPHPGPKADQAAPGQRL